MNLTRLLQRKPACAGVLLFSAIIFHAPLIFGDLAYPTRDFFLHYSWVGQVAQSLREGNWYPRWMPLALGELGQPVFYYYSPLFHLAAGLLSQVTASHWIAMKIVLLGSSWLTGWVTYLFVGRRVPGRWALFAGVCLQFTPLMAAVCWRLSGWPWYASFPLFLVLLYRTIEFPEWPARIDPVISIATALLAMTHVLSAFVALICLPAAVVCSSGGPSPWRGRIHSLLWWSASCLLGLGLAAIYLYPALTTLSLISPESWGGKDLDWRSSFAFSAITAFQFGVRSPAFQWIVPPLVLAPVIAGMLAWLNMPRGGAAARPLLGRLLIVSIVALFFSSEISFPVWKIFRPLQLVQFPIRFLYITTAGGLLANIFCLMPPGPRRKTGAGRAVMAAPLAASLGAALFVTGYLTATALRPVDPNSGISSLRPGVPEYRPATAGPHWDKYAMRGGLERDCDSLGIACESLVNQSQRRIWAIQCPEEATVLLPVFAFPSWNLTVDGGAAGASIDPDTGLYRVTLMPGAHQIALAWIGLPEERTGAVLSLMSVLAWAGLCILRIRSSFAGVAAGRGGPPLRSIQGS